MTRRMRSSAFRDDVFARRYAPNVEPLNRFIDELCVARGEASVPYIDPDCGGVDAKVLFLYQDPGPKAAGTANASGFLSCENDDPSAENLNVLLREADLPWTVCVPWNVVPWYINRAGASHEVEEALLSLHRFRLMVARLQVVALMGNSAQSAWAKYARRYASDARAIRVFPSCHTSVRGLTAGSRRSMAEGKQEVLRTFRQIRVAVLR